MEAWRKLAIRLFPDHKSIYSEPEENVWSVLFDLNQCVVAAHEAADAQRLNNIYEFAEWCHSQKDSDPDIWMAAYMAFYEHLAEDPATYAAIPERLTPEVFEDVLPQYEDRLDNKKKYPFERPGSFADLLQMYDAARGTNFVSRIDEWKNLGA